MLINTLALIATKFMGRLRRLEDILIDTNLKSALVTNRRRGKTQLSVDNYSEGLYFIHLKFCEVGFRASLSPRVTQEDCGYDVDLAKYILAYYFSPEILMTVNGMIDAMNQV